MCQRKKHAVTPLAKSRKAALPARPTRRFDQLSLKKESLSHETAGQPFAKAAWEGMANFFAFALRLCESERQKNLLLAAHGGRL